MLTGRQNNLFALFLKTKIYLLKEQAYVIRNYYKKLSFFLSDSLFFLFYLPFNPYRICRRFSKGKEGVYGETPLSAYERIAKECELTTSDCFFELGSGRGRGAFWLSSFVQCRVMAVEQIPLFARIAKAIGFLMRRRGLCFLNEDFFHVDLSQASVIYLYGTCMEDLAICQMAQKFSKLSRKTKIVTISFSLCDFATHSFSLEKSFPLSFPWGKTKAFLQRPTGDYEGLPALSCHQKQDGVKSKKISSL
jgi:hypothetical protein